MNVHTTNAAIIGNFNTSDSLNLATTNSPIKADVTAFNHDNVNNVVLHTTNSYVACVLINLTITESCVL